MKKLYFCFSLLLVFVTNSNAQNDCSTPYQIYGGTTQTFTLDTSTVNSDTTNDYGCLTMQANVTWLYFKVCNPGSITLLLTSYGTSSNDIDFVAWGPLSSASDCGLDSSQIVDCSMSVSSTEMVDFTGTLAGQYYKIMISNYSNNSGTFTISQTGGSGQACSLANSCGAAIQPICKVSVDPVVNHNFIFWDKDTTYTGTYDIQRETTTMGVYATIATVANNDTSVYEDLLSNPMVQAFKYRIHTSDTCGNNFNSPPHQTIHLLASMSMLGYPQLSWNPYQGFGYGTYYIYRGTSASSLSLYDSISASSTTYTDVNPVPGTNSYVIAVFPPVPCNPSRSISDMSFSNTSVLVVTGISENTIAGLSISPNPATNELNISTSGAYSFMNVELYDISGRKLISRTTSNTAKEILDLSSISNGYYVIRITTDKGIAQQKIVVSK